MTLRVLAVVLLIACPVDAINVARTATRLTARAVLSVSDSLVHNATKADPYAIYEGKYVVKLTVCNNSVATVNAALQDIDCRLLGGEDLKYFPSGGCGVEYAICASSAITHSQAGTFVNLTASGASPISNLADRFLLGQMPVEVASRDAGAFFRKIGGLSHGWEGSAASFGEEFYSAYRNLDAIEERIRSVVQASGGTATLEHLAPKTHEGRTIKAVRIRGTQWVSGRPRVVLTFQLHAREWITGMAGCYIVEHLIEAIKNEQYNVRGVEVILVPIGNPDGFVYSATKDRFWRKNRRDNRERGPLDPKKFEICNGVDLNRNFDVPDTSHVWSPRDFCTATYTGPAVLSEPESAAMGKLIEEAPTLVHIDIHSYGQWVLGPYSYTAVAHEDKSQIDELGLSMQRAMTKSHNVTYMYTTSSKHGLSEGTFADWSTTKGAYGYIYELRPLGFPDAFAPAADQIQPTSQETLQGIYAAIDWAKNKV